MTTVSCTPVKSAGHMAACKSYLEDERTVMSAGWNLGPEALADECDRYCVHALVDRTDLETGRRHDRGAPEALELRRSVKDDLDARYGLEHVMNLREKDQQMVYGPVSYSKVQGRSGEANAERIAARQGRSYKRQLFQDCAEAMNAEGRRGVPRRASGLVRYAPIQRLHSPPRRLRRRDARERG